MKARASSDVPDASPRQGGDGGGAGGDWVLDTSDPAHTQRIGTAVGAAAEPGDVIALTGELGAGKTQFVRGLAEGLGIDPGEVSSPTFVISQEYGPGERRQGGEPERAGLVLVHIDAYRLTGPEELGSIGWEGEGEELRHQAVVAVEWAERVAPALPDERLDVSLAHTADGRRITLRAGGKWRQRLGGIEQRAVSNE